MPTANTANIALCDDGDGTVDFDLTSVENTVTGGAAGVTVAWFSDMALTSSIASPATYASSGETVYAQVTNTTTTCTASTPVTLTVNALPTCSISGSSSVAPNTQDVSYAAPAGMTTYAWSITSGDATIDGAANAQNVTIDFGSNNSTIQLVITDANGCMSTCDLVVTTSLNCSINGPTETCTNTTGLTFTGPAGATTYAWSITTGDATINGSSTAQSLTVDAESNDFTVELTLSPSSSPTCSQMVTVNPLPTANTASIALCDDGDGTVDFDLTSVENTVTGGTSDVTVAWFSDMTLTTSIATPAAHASSGGTVYAQVTNTTTTCTVSAAVTLTVNPLPTVTLNDPADVCTNGTDMMFTGTPTDANGSFSTTAGAGLTDNGDGTATLDLSAADAGTYDVTYNYTDGNNCMNSQTVSITINPVPTLAAISSNPTTCNATDGSITLTLTNVADGNYTINYEDASATAQTFTNVAVSGGSATITNLTAGTYNNLSITDSNTCTSTEDVDITLTHECYSLGNQVFTDSNNSGHLDGSETGIDGVTLQLLNDDGSVYDSDPNTPGDQALTVTTANGGYYRFDDLPAGDYIVEVIASNFTGVNPLNGFDSSTGANQEADPDSDGDINDNGLDTQISGATRSGIVTLGTPEPTGEAEPGSYGAGSTTGTAATDLFSNLTVDFGFFNCNISTGDLMALVCNDNSTITDNLDDYLTFTLNPAGNGLGSSYNVTVNSGTITPTSANYGAATTFQLQNGSAGLGNVTVTIAESTNSSCTLDVTITDPGSCAQNVDLADFALPDFPPCSEVACHVVDTDLMLGTMISADNGTLADSTGTGDNDDGITFPNNLRLGTSINVQVQVTNNTGMDAYVYGWADWNDDGDFDDAGEDMIVATYTNAGVFTISEAVFIPNTAIKTSEIALRFRISTDQTAVSNPCGPATCAPDGEVEDYLIQLECPPTICLPPNIQINRE